MCVYIYNICKYIYLYSVENYILFFGKTIVTVKYCNFFSVTSNAPQGSVLQAKSILVILNRWDFDTVK